MLAVLYGILVVVSTIIVAAYIGMQLLSQQPDQKEQPPLEPPAGSSAGQDGAGSGQTQEQPPSGPPPLERRPDVFNIFLAATDVEGFRTDVMMVMQYDTVQQRVGVVSIPRDTITRRDKGNPKLVYGGGGVSKRIEEVSQMLGVPIDYYVKVDIGGFVALVDYLGGVDVDIPLDMNYDDPYQDLHIHFTKGYQHLDGQQAMEVARYRHDNKDSPNYQANQWYSDVQRTQMQQQILVALAKKVLSWNSLTKVKDFVDIFQRHVDTDLTLGHMVWFAEKALGLDLSAGVEAQTLEGRGDAKYRGQAWCFELDRDKALDAVNRLINPYTRALTLDEMDVLQADSYYFNDQ